MSTSGVGGVWGPKDFDEIEIDEALPPAEAQASVTRGSQGPLDLRLPGLSAGYGAFAAQLATPAEDAAAIDRSLAAWKTDATSAPALPLAGLVPSERRLHADVEKALYAARGDIAAGTLISRGHFDRHVDRNRPAIEGLAKAAEGVAAQYEAAGNPLRAEYYRGLARSTRSRFEEIVALNGDQADRLHGPLPGPAPKPLAPLETPKNDGLRGDWNRAVTDGLNDLRKTDLRKLGREGAADALKQVFPDETAVPEADREKYREARDAISKELAGALVSLPAAESLADHLTGLVDGATRYLHAQITFARAEDDLKSEIAAKGGLYPGEDKAAGKALAPIAAEVDASKAKLETALARTKTRLSATGGADVAWKPEMLFVKSVNGKAAVTFEAQDFKAKVHADVKIDGPLTPGAKLTATGGAEVAAGKYSASVKGQVTVESLWTDPVLGPTATVDLSLGYADGSTSAVLRGKAIIPTGASGQDSKRYEAGLDLKKGPYSATLAAYANLPETRPSELGMSAGVGYTKGNVTWNAGVAATSIGGAPPTYSANVGLKLTF